MTLDSEPIRQDDPTPNADQQADGQPKAANEQIIPTVAKPEMPPINCQCQLPDQKKKHWIDYATVSLELVGLFVLCVYAAYTTKIYRANQQAADAARKTVIETQRQTRIDERPWLKIESFGDQPDIPEPAKILVGHPLKIPFEIKNFGKTAAREIKAGFVIQILPNGEPPGIYGWKVTHTFKQGVLYPGESLKGQAIRVKLVGSGSGSVDLITREELRNLRAGKAHVAFWGQAWYFDIFGIPHWTKFCRGFFAPPTDTGCSEFNDVDDNDGTSDPK